ncbi:MAG: hypothetical protein JHC63_03100 [Acidimicrobiia bacterium]|jgi:hypothetical protein|nr:hypothetical protein [Acidimicrobiia bacterium]
MTSDNPERLVPDMRNVRYGEVLGVFARDGRFEAEVFGTQLINDCPQELWETLDATEIAAEMGAIGVKLNGPRYWTLDAFGQKVAVAEPVLRDFNGITMRRIATVDLGEIPKLGPYNETKVNRGVIFFWDEGQTVHELINPEGHAYVMQALCTGVDPTMSPESLLTLGERLELPDGWSYRTRVLDEELIVDTTATIATVLQDEFENSYTLPY